MLSEEVVIINSHSPSSDLYNSNPAGDYINAKYFDVISWLLAQKTGGTNTGTAVVTVLAASAADGTGAEAVVFKYRKKTTGASVAQGSITDAEAAGFETTANEDTIYEIEVESAKLPEGKPYVALQLTEETNDPVLGCVVALGRRPRYLGSTVVSALS